MFRILLVHLSSMGDVIHNMPMVSDIALHYPNARLDWVVEEGFAELPRLHPAVDTVIPVALRRWRRQLRRLSDWLPIWREGRGSHRLLHARSYDLVFDTQSLIKSALVARCAQGTRVGMDWQSAREPIICGLYDRRLRVPRGIHAITRYRALAGAALGYTPPPRIDYGLRLPDSVSPPLSSTVPYVMLLTATSKDAKLWPEPHWLALGERLAQQGFDLWLPWGTPRERERVERLIAAGLPRARATPSLDLTTAARWLLHAQGVVGVDTGFAHLAVALGTPTLSLFVASNPALTGLFADASVPYTNLGGIGQCPTAEAVAAESVRLFSRLTCPPPPAHFFAGPSG